MSTEKAVVVRYYTNEEKLEVKRSPVKTVTENVVELQNGKKFSLSTRKQIGGKRLLFNKDAKLLMGVTPAPPQKAPAPIIKQVKSKGAKRPPALLKCLDMKNFTVMVWKNTLKGGAGDYEVTGYYTSLDNLLVNLRRTLVAKKAVKQDFLYAEQIESALKMFNESLQASVNEHAIEFSDNFVESYKKLARLHDIVAANELDIKDVIAAAKAMKKAKRSKK